MEHRTDDHTADEVVQSSGTYDSAFDSAVHADDDTVVANYLLPQLTYDAPSFSYDEGAYDGDGLGDYHVLGHGVGTSLPTAHGSGSRVSPHNQARRAVVMTEEADSEAGMHRVQRPHDGTRQTIETPTNNGVGAESARADSAVYRETSLRAAYDDRNEETESDDEGRRVTASGDDAVEDVDATDGDEAADIEEAYESSMDMDDNTLDELEEEEGQKGVDAQDEPLTLSPASPYADEESNIAAHGDGDESGRAVLVGDAESDADVEVSHSAAHVTENDTDPTTLSGDVVEGEVRAQRTTRRHVKSRLDAAAAYVVGPSAAQSTAVDYTNAFSFNRIKDLMRIENSLAEGGGGIEAHKGSVSGSTIISRDAARAMTEAVALLLRDLAQCASQEAVRRRRRTVQYDDVARVVQLYDRFSFLCDVLPTSVLPMLSHTPLARTRRHVPPAAVMPAAAVAASQAKHRTRTDAGPGEDSISNCSANTRYDEASTAASHETVAHEPGGERTGCAVTPSRSVARPIAGNKGPKSDAHATRHGSHRIPVTAEESGQGGLRQMKLNFTR